MGSSEYPLHFVGSWKGVKWVASDATYATVYERMGIGELVSHQLKTRIPDWISDDYPLR